MADIDKAMYRLTVAQRDAAWAEVKRLRDVVRAGDTLAHRASKALDGLPDVWHAYMPSAVQAWEDARALVALPEDE